MNAPRSLHRPSIMPLTLCLCCGIGVGMWVAIIYGALRAAGVCP